MGNLFDIHPTKTISLSGEKGTTPLLSNTAINNGVNDYCVEKPTEKGNIITFSDTTESQKTVFYQNKPFIGFSHVQGMYPKVEEVWNEKICLYFISSFKQAIGEHYDYATKFNRTIASNINVYLPVLVDDNNKEIVDNTNQFHNLGYVPNFHYMEERISELMEERISSLDAYLKVSKLVNYKLSKKDKEVLNTKTNYVKFKLQDIFEIVGTKSLDAGYVQFEKEGINFVGRTDENNGVQGKITRQDFEPNESNTITATVIGNYKYVKYQLEPYYCSQNINKLTLKLNKVLNEEIALYLMASIQKFVNKYNGQQGGYKLEDIKNHIIVLPIKNGFKKEIIENIDFNYMEKYIKVLKKIIIEDVVKYKNRIINEMKNIIK